MSKETVTEWAIQDEATGEYWDYGWGPKAARYKSHAKAIAATGEMRSPAWNVYRETLQIVPAPPREMTDAECWEWFHTKGALAFIHPASEKGWGCTVHDILCQYGATPCDAIRAARKKLEGK